MPLIILTGFPSSGKTAVSRAIKKWFETDGKRKAIIISDEEQLNKQGRDHHYNHASVEKQLRSDLKSAVQRSLTHDIVVILDAANYIKGYRYELYCMSKEHKTTHCIVETIVNQDLAWKWNEVRPESNRYSKEIFDALIQRFEAPNSMNRWDSPLICVHNTELDHKSANGQDFELEIESKYLDEIDAALFGRRIPNANLSTQSQPMESPDFLYNLDTKTRDAVQFILNAQKMRPGQESFELRLPDAPQDCEPLRIGRPLAAAELHRLRRQFINYTKTHPLPIDGIIKNFVHYLNTSTTAT